MIHNTLIKCFVHSPSYLFLLFSGVYGGFATHVPIPNTIVKRARDDGTALRVWESSSTPDFFFARIPTRSTKTVSMTGYFFVQKGEFRMTEQEVYSTDIHR